ncbi:dysbindin-A-like [Betta splendens]|uniref:Dysbindin-A-like n=1 Tax=Betta splendens TaxID=158456 RepID=A0A6P7KYN0_BETSP|nr:dysbindin-A-like [Betta splendens]
MFENLRERFQMVQRDFTMGFKTLGDKSKDTKIKRRHRSEETLPHFGAGVEILSRYEESWFLLHKQTKDCAQAAEVAYGDIVMLTAHWDRRGAALTQLQEQLQSLPAFVIELNAITAKIAHLEGDFEEMESRLVYLETMCCQCEQGTLKQQHTRHLEVYKKKKRNEVEMFEAELNSEHAQKVAELEQAMTKQLRERQKLYEEAFKQDMQQYLTTGYLLHRKPTGSGIYALDQMLVTNILDHKALDDFLNSTSDGTESSPTSGPDLKSCSSKSSTSQMNQVLSRNDHLSNQSTGDWRQKEEAANKNDDYLVQSDEEVIEPDVSLLGLQDIDTTRHSDESDSAGELPSG